MFTPGIMSPMPFDAQLQLYTHEQLVDLVKCLIKTNQKLVSESTFSYDRGYREGTEVQRKIDIALCVDISVRQKQSLKYKDAHTAVQDCITAIRDQGENP